MDIQSNIRSKMVGVLVDSITDPGIDSNIRNKIIFYNNNDEIMSEMKYDSINNYSSGGITRYSLIMNGGNQLSAQSLSNGTVSKFVIYGKISEPNTYGIVVSGAVGNLNSKADIRLNKTIWSSSTIIRLNISFVQR